MKRWLWIVVVCAVVGAGVWLGTRGSAPQEVPFAKAKRETLVSILTTNGKTEPEDWTPVHAEREGLVARVLVERGQKVGVGTALAVLEAPTVKAETAAAQARVEQARNELGSLKNGGRAAELAEVDGLLKRLNLELEAGRRELGVVGRLVEKKAAARVELDQAKDRVQQTEAQVQSAQARRAALVGTGDVRAAEARVREAEAALEQARKSEEKATVRSPRTGIVYDLPVKAGSWIGAGELVAKVGKTERLKVTVYVDEPDLGRVKKGLPVTVTWDAKPGRQWAGTVEQVPTQVLALGTRQVGEVATIAENPEGDLPPGANINASIRAQVVEGAVTIPKAALQRQEGVLGVYVLAGGKLEWRKVEIGVSSETRTEVKSGVTETDAVALPSEKPYRAGQAVTATYPQ